MRVLFLVTGMLICGMLVRAQSFRSVHVPLDSGRTAIYDSLFYANDWRVEWVKKIPKRNSHDFDEHWMEKMLRLGDKMPDLKLPIRINDSIHISNFHDLKGKIIILDFWATNCSACIGGFPKMKKLQEKFSDKIQVILVNTSETDEQIKQRMGKNFNKLPDLPSLTGARYLIPYFPTSGIPYHVWIDQKGIVRVLGSSFNTYEKKIDDLLKGKEIFCWQMQTTRPAFNPDISYAQIIGRKISLLQYTSFFTIFNKDYAPGGKVYGSSVIGKMDKTTSVRRNTFVNWTITELYQAANKSILTSLSPYKKKYLFNPFDVIYDVKDTLRYSNSHGTHNYIDTAYLKSMYCYEQSCPISISDNNAEKMMAEDLNTYFGKLYGTYGRIEKRTLPAYVIIKLAGNKFKKLYSKSGEYKENRIVKNGKNFIRRQATTFSGLFDEKNFIYLLEKKMMLINETGIDARIDIDLPVDATLADIKQALKPYGLDIIERNTEVELLVISDTKAK